ncbi:MAG TPA: hypothetical protein VGK13_01140 [Methanocellaceae archaeon]
MTEKDISKDDVRLFMALVRKNLYWLALILILFVALWYRMGIIESYIIPTYGNTMYHVGIEREAVETGFYPTTELSYGGGFPNFYVPAYRLLIASMSVATGIDPMIMSGLMTIVLALFILLAIYVLTYQLSKNKYVALFSAFFFVMSPELTIFTMRALPELLGLFLIPLTIYFMMKKEWAFAIIGSIVTALTHQMTLATLVGIIGMYAVLQLAWAGWLYYRSRKDTQVAYMDKLKYAIMCFVTAFMPCATYGLWQVYSLGTLSIFGIAQVVNKEGNVVDLPLFLRSGIFVLIFFAIGLASILYGWWTSRTEKAKPAEASGYGFSLDTNAVLLILSWLIVTLVLMKNDLLGIHIFMDRFFTFFVIMAVIVAGYGMYAVLSAIDLDILKEKQE